MPACPPLPPRTPLPAYRIHRAAASLFALVKAGEAALKRAKAGGGAEGDASRLLPVVDASFLLSALDRMDSVFGIFYEPSGYEAARGGVDGGAGDGDGEALPEAMEELLAKRLAARESKDWATADAVRDEITALGYAVKVRRTDGRTTGFRQKNCTLCVLTALCALRAALFCAFRRVWCGPGAFLLYLGGYL